MKITHVVSSLDPAQGGIASVVAHLAATQTFLGHPAQIISNDWNADDFSHRVEYQAIPGFAQVRHHLLPAPSRLEQVFPVTSRRTLMPMFQGSDVVHLHGIWDTILIASAGAARALDIPYVVTPHGMLDPWSLSQGRWKKRIALAMGYRKMICRAACLHALNDDEQTLWAPLGLDRPVEVVPNGVLRSVFESPPARGEFRARHPMLADRPYVLFLSRLHHKKGLDILAKAFARVLLTQPNAVLVVAGPDAGALGDFENLVDRLGIKRNVFVVGPLYGREKLAAIADASCFCLPSRQEGFSMAITESLACGTPVVISEDCHFPEVSAVGAGLVLPLSAGHIAQGLCEMLEMSPEKRRAMSHAGRTLVFERFTWDTIAHRTIAMYKGSAEARNAVGALVTE